MIFIELLASLLSFPNANSRGKEGGRKKGGETEEKKQNCKSFLKYCLVQIITVVKSGTLRSEHLRLLITLLNRILLALPYQKSLKCMRP